MRVGLYKPTEKRSGRELAEQLYSLEKIAFGDSGYAYSENLRLSSVVFHEIRNKYRKEIDFDVHQLYNRAEALQQWGLVQTSLFISV